MHSTGFVFFFAALIGLPLRAWSLGFNCGADRSVLAADGVRYIADVPWTPGSTGGYVGGEATPWLYAAFHHDGPESEQLLYQAQRVGAHLYRFATSPGSHELTLRWAEYEANGPEARLLTVTVNQDTLLSDFDVLFEAGKERTVDVRRLVEVTDRQVEISIVSSAGTAALAAIALEPISAPIQRLDPVSGLEVWPTYGGAFLRWDAASPIHLDGYGVSVRNSQGQTTWTSHRYVPWAVAPTGASDQLIVYANATDGRPGRLTQKDGVATRTPEESALDGYELSVDPADLRIMESSIPGKPPMPADLLASDGLREGRLHLRGTNSLEAPKKSYKFRIKAGGAIDSSTVVALAAGFADEAMLREVVIHEIMRAMGHQAYGVTPVRITLNDRYIGVYSQIEEADESFLARSGLDPYGRSFHVNRSLSLKPDLATYIESFENTNASDWDRREIATLVQEINTVDDRELETWFRATFDLEQLIDWYAAQVFSVNQDFMTHNYILHQNRNDGRWRILAWDVDQILSDPNASALLGNAENPNNVHRFNRLVERLTSVPSLRRKYLLRQLELLDGPFSAGSTTAFLDLWLERIRDDARIDPYKRQREQWDPFVDAVDEVGQFLVERVSALRKDAIAEMLPPWVNLSINEVILNGSGDIAGAELHFRGEAPYTPAALFLSDDPQNPRKLPLDGASYSPDSYHHTPLSPIRSDWLGLFVQMAGNTLLADSLSLRPIAGAASVGRHPNGHGVPRSLSAPSPGAANSWEPPLSMRVDTMGDIVEPLSTLRARLRIQNNGELPVQSTVRIQALGEGGVWLASDPIMTLTPPRLEPGTTWTDTLELPLTPAMVTGRHDLVFIAEELGGQGAQLGPEQGRATLVFFVDDGPARALAINEICANNHSIIADRFGEFDDWVELVNTGEAPLDLSGHYLTDDFERAPYRWALPSYAFPPRQLRTIWLDGTPSQGVLHANFRLDYEGEELTLVRDDAGVPVIVDQVLFGHQPPDQSTGRYPDAGTSWQKFDHPSPGARNKPPILSP